MRRQENWALADLDRVPLKRDRLDPRHGVVARVRDPDRAVAECECARPRPTGTVLIDPWSNVSSAKTCTDWSRLLAIQSRSFATATAVGLKPAIVTLPESRTGRVDTRDRRFPEDRPDRAGADSNLSCALARTPPTSIVRHLTELGIDLGEAAEQAVGDPQALALAVCDPGRLIVERDQACVRPLGGVEPSQVSVLDVPDPDRPCPEGDRARPVADRNLVDDLVRRRVDHTDVVRIDERRRARARAA